MHVDLHRLPGRFGIDRRRVLGRKEEAARRIVDRHQLLVELFVAALKTPADGLAQVLMLGGLQVGQVRLRRQEGERDVEGVGDVFLGLAHLGHRGDVAHALGKQLHFQAGLADQDAAGAAAAKLLIPLRFEAVAFFLADHFIGADDCVGDGAVLELRLLEGGVIADERDNDLVGELQLEVLPDLSDPIRVVGDDFLER